MIASASAVERVERALASIDEREDELNAFVTVMRESALRDALAVDEALARGEDVGPLAGLPYALKDAFLTRDAPTTGGSSVWRADPAPADAELVTRLRRAGAILVGKTNMNEFGWGLDRSVGPVANPVARGRSAGGSSGGSAAAVAAGSVPFAIGTDGGGSIRMPAAFCGVAGIKPTHGTVPRGGAIPGGRSLTDPGPIAARVADLRTVFRVLTGSDAAPAQAPAAPVLGVVAGAFATCKPEIADALVRAVDTLPGTTTIEVDVDDAPPHWLAIFSAEAAAALASLPELPRMSADLRRLVTDGTRVDEADYAAAQAYRERLASRLDAALDRCDALLTPTVPSPAPVDEPEWEDDDFFGDMRWTVPANLTGHPAVTVPVAAAPLPAGLQLIGRRGADDALLALAERVEEHLNDKTEETSGRRRRCRS